MCRLDAGSVSHLLFQCSFFQFHLVWILLFEHNIFDSESIKGVKEDINTLQIRISNLSKYIYIYIIRISNCNLIKTRIIIDY